MHLYGSSDRLTHTTCTKENPIIRVVFMGHAGVGKSALIKQSLYREFVHTYKETIEDTYHYHGDNFDLEILDTSGTYNFPDMMKLAINFGDIFVLVFSVEDYASFDRVNELRKEVTAVRGFDIPILVVGNKADSAEREVSKPLADSIVSIEWGCSYHDVTAKDADAACGIFNCVLNHFPSLYGEKLCHVQKQEDVTRRGRNKKDDNVRSKLRTSLTSLAKMIHIKK